MQLKNKPDFSSEQEEYVVFDGEILPERLSKHKSGDFQPQIAPNTPHNSLGITLLKILGSFATGVVITTILCVLGAIFIANSPDNFSNSDRCDDPCTCPATTID